MLRLNAKRALEHDLIERLEKEGHYVEIEDIDQGELSKRLNDPFIFTYSKD